MGRHYSTNKGQGNFIFQPNLTKCEISKVGIQKADPSLKMKDNDM